MCVDLSLMIDNAVTRVWSFGQGTLPQTRRDTRCQRFPSVEERRERLGLKAAVACVSPDCAPEAYSAAALPSDTAVDANLGAVHPAEWPGVPPGIPVDARLEAHIAAWLASMARGTKVTPFGPRHQKRRQATFDHRTIDHRTIEQKVGQLIQADIASISPEDLHHYPLGTILNGGDSSRDNDDCAPRSKWHVLADRFYDASTTGAERVQSGHRHRARAVD
jgi:hypothetical protein